MNKKVEPRDFRATITKLLKAMLGSKDPYPPLQNLIDKGVAAENDSYVTVESTENMINILKENHRHVYGDEVFLRKRADRSSK